MYGKLIDGAMMSAPKKVEYNNTIIYNPPDSVYEALGYYPVVHTEMPGDAPDGYHYESAWEQTETEILQTWHLVEDSDEISADEALEILFGGVVL